MCTFLRWLVISLSLTAHAETTLLRVVDGDTVIVNEDGQTLHVRLLDIDAPELHQSYGKQSRRSLQQWCQPPVQVIAHGHDKYGRTLGLLLCNGEDASEHQVSNGAAWFNQKYSKRKSLEALEQTAQSNQQGLWQETEPIPPWLWRKRYAKNYQPH